MNDFMKNEEYTQAKKNSKISLFKDRENVSNVCIVRSYLIVPGISEIYA